jgi:hypothetical protein
VREGALRKPLWICPACGQSFVTRNMSHSCCRVSEEGFFSGREAQRTLYRAFLAATERCGPVTVNVNKAYEVGMQRWQPPT